jgi:predicted acylesterase/phospholipase RssA
MRERVIAWIKRRPLFRNVSVRLIADLVDHYGLETVPPAGLWIKEPSIVVVAHGSAMLVELENGTAPADADLDVSHLLGARPVIPLGSGVHFDTFGGTPSGINWNLAYLKPFGSRAVHALRMPLADFRNGLPRVLVNGLDPDAAKVTGFADEAEGVEPEPILVWMATEPRAGRPLDALTHLLAAAVGRELPHPVAVVTMSKARGLTVETWTNGGFAPWTGRLLLPIDAKKLREIVLDEQAPDPRRGRVFIAHLDDPLHLPAPSDPTYGFAAGTRFDHAVLLTDVIPEQIPGRLHDLLLPRDSGFCRVIPTVLRPPTPPRPTWQRWFTDGGATFETDDEPTDDRTDLEGPEGEKARLRRDACWLRLDLPALARAWAARPSPRACLSQLGGAAGSCVDRWARAVTFRRVGVAVSGGGASAYRLVGLLRRLEQANVPVDVIAGLSGGALVAAYYAARGGKGLEQVVANGPWFGALLPLASVSSWFIEAAIDMDLGGARIEDADVRYVPVAAELAGGAQPRARVVKSATMGEAVRVSGTLPLVFGTTEKGLEGKRYTDGAAASLVPAEIVRCCGADLTVSYNVIGEPPDGDPLRALPGGLGTLLARLPLVGRLADLWVWTSFLMARASREFGECADVSITYCSDPDEPFEPLAWSLAGDIADKGYHDEKVVEGVATVVALWRRLQHGPKQQPPGPRASRP